MAGYKKEIVKYIKENRLNEEKINYQGYLMRIVEYKNNHDIIVEFQDEYKERVHRKFN